METSVKKHTSVNYELIEKALENIKTFARKNNYQIKDANNLEWYELMDSNFLKNFEALSLRKKKKLYDLIARFNKHETIANANKLLHFIFTKIHQGDKRVKILPSAKELAIQQKRKEYKAALELVKKAYADYKAEKGEFYKKK